MATKNHPIERVSITFFVVDVKKVKVTLPLNIDTCPSPGQSPAAPAEVHKHTSKIPRTLPRRKSIPNKETTEEKRVQHTPGVGVERLKVTLPLGIDSCLISVASKQVPLKNLLRRAQVRNPLGEREKIRPTSGENGRNSPSHWRNENFATNPLLAKKAKSPPTTGEKAKFAHPVAKRAKAPPYQAQTSHQNTQIPDRTAPMNLLGDKATQ